MPGEAKEKSEGPLESKGSDVLYPVVQNGPNSLKKVGDRCRGDILTAPGTGV